MKNKTNEANKYECVLCETGEGSIHGGLCSCNKLNKIEILKKLSKSFNEENEQEPFLSLEYVEETKRIYDNLINGGLNEYQERAINDIISDIFRYFNIEGHSSI